MENYDAKSRAYSEEITQSVTSNSCCIGACNELSNECCHTCLLQLQSWRNACTVQRRKHYLQLRWNISTYAWTIETLSTDRKSARRSWNMQNFITKHMRNSDACRNISNLLKLTLTWIIGKKYVKKRYVKFSGREADARAQALAERGGVAGRGEGRSPVTMNGKAPLYLTQYSGRHARGAALTFDWWHAWDTTTATNKCYHFSH